MEQQLESDQRRVQVWSGRHVIEDHVAQSDPEASDEAAVRRRFAGLLVTSEPLAPALVRA